MRWSPAPFQVIRKVPAGSVGDHKVYFFIDICHKFKCNHVDMNNDALKLVAL